jgi:hypothetical protein
MKTSMGVAMAGTPWMAFPSPEKTHAKCTKLCIFEECARGVTISSSLRLFCSNGRLELLLNGSHFLFLLVMIFAPLLTFEDLAQSFGVSVYRLGDIIIAFNGEWLHFLELSLGAKRRFASIRKILARNPWF